MGLKNTLIIGLLGTVLSFGYYFSTSHATISGKWQSPTDESIITFFDDGTMNYQGVPATFSWIGQDNMRIEVSGIGGSIIKWIGGDIVVQVHLEHELITSPFWGIRDTLTIKKNNDFEAKYQRAF